jgi:DNA-binding transcriptional LysR family regulator
VIDKLEMFIALAREEHFGRAAEACGVTQPSLSAAIRQLEDQLGVQLVWRGSRYQGLTPEGQRALDWARRIVGDARALRAEMRAARHGLSGNLRLAAIPTALPMVAALSGGLARRHPDLRVTVRAGASADILRMLDDLEIDAGLTYLAGDPLGRVTAVPLYDERLVLVLRADDPLAAQTSMRWADTADLPLCLLTPDMQNRRIVAQHLATAGVTAVPRVESSSVTVLIAHVLAGGWVTILPLQAAEAFLGDGRLTARPLTDPEARHTVGLIAPVREPHTPVLDALLAEAAALARRL